MDSYGNYISGTYRQKYYKTFNRGGRMYGLEILEKGYEGASKEIGDLQAVRLTIEGDQGGIDSPIVKTSLSFTMADAWDEPDTETVKHGNWQEFYTPDSTKFLVRLGIASGPHFGGGNIWSGYITPDSWQEGLGYRESITITARDNIGHLQDFEFDLAPDGDGLVKVRDIIIGAMAKVNLPMDFYINADQQDYSQGIYYDGVNIVDTYIYAGHFDGMDWYAALEEVLEGLGFVLRFCFGNKVSVGPIRNISHLASTDGALAANDKEVVFLGGGTRSIDPPYRSIREEMVYEYEQEAELDPLLGLSEFSQNPTNLSYTIESYINSMFDGSGSEPAYANVNNDYRGWFTGAFLDPSRYGILESVNDPNAEGDSFKEYAFIPANTAVDVNAAYTFYAMSPEFTLRIVFARRAAQLSSFDATKLSPHYDAKLYKITYDITYSDAGGTNYYWSGSGWVTSQQRHVYEYEATAESDMADELKIQVHAATGIIDGAYSIIIHKVEYKQAYNWGTGVYARVGAILVSANVQHTESDTITTINDETYNVRFNRRPKIGILSLDSGRVVPGNYQNILYYRPESDRIALYAYKLNWGGDRGTKPFPALVHMQLLVNHLVPMQVLEGDCMVEGEIWPGGVYKYKGKRFLLLSGTYDFVSGRMQGVVLREFKEYSDVWPRGSAGPATDSKSKTRR